MEFEASQSSAKKSCKEVCIINMSHANLFYTNGNIIIIRYVVKMFSFIYFTE